METKICTGCRSDKPLSEFHNSKTHKGGKYPRCKLCVKAYQKQYLAEHPEKVRATRKRTYLKHKEKKDAYKKDWYAKNRVDQVQKCRDRYSANKERYAEKNKQYRDENKSELKGKYLCYYAANKSDYIARVAARKKHVKRATPAWADMAAIKAVYAKSEEMSRNSGTEYHVDHVIPLRGKLVSGLHVDSNLRVILATENLSKSNSFVR